MKFSLIASGLALAGAVIAAPAAEPAPAPELEERTLFLGCLNSLTARTVADDRK